MNIFSTRVIPFLKSEEGSQSVELVVMAPLLVWAIVSMLSFTDAFRVRAMATDATAVMADAISRQTFPIDQAYIEGLQSIAGRLTGRGDTVGVRVTQLSCTNKCKNTRKRTLKVIFSKTSDGQGLAELNDNDFKSGDRRAQVPMMSKGDRIVLVETSFTHKPLMNVGLKETQVDMAQVTRMRFAPQLCWQDCGV